MGAQIWIRVISCISGCISSFSTPSGLDFPCGFFMKHGRILVWLLRRLGAGLKKGCNATSYATDQEAPPNNCSIGFGSLD